MPGQYTTPSEREVARLIFETDPDATDRKVAKIIGKSGQTVGRLRRHYGWRRAVCVTPGSPDDAGGGDSSPGEATAFTAGPSPAARRALIDELWRAVTRQVLSLRETGHAGEAAAGGGKCGAGTGGGSVSALMTVARTVEKLCDLERAAPGPQSGAGAVAAPLDEGPEDIDEFRNEIARRLEAVVAEEGY